MHIEAGKYYTARDGQKVGPMKFDHEADVYVWDCATTHKCWGSDGEYLVGYGEHNLDLIAEWTDTPDEGWSEWLENRWGGVDTSTHDFEARCIGGIHSYRTRPRKPAPPREFWIVINDGMAWDTEWQAEKHAAPVESQIIHVREVLE